LGGQDADLTLFSLPPLSPNMSPTMAILPAATMPQAESSEESNKPPDHALRATTPLVAMSPNHSRRRTHTDRLTQSEETIATLTELPQQHARNVPFNRRELDNDIGGLTH
jgi:hypothetical protein